MGVRKARPSDAARIAVIGAASWRATFRGLVPDAMLDTLDIEGSETRWRDTIKRLPDNVLVFEGADGVSGWVCAGPVSEKSKLNHYEGEIYGIHIDPSCKRQGQGSALLSAAFDSLHVRGCRHVYVLVLEDNKDAAQFYRKHGGRAAGQYVVNFGGRDLPELAFGWML